MKFVIAILVLTTSFNIAAKTKLIERDDDYNVDPQQLQSIIDNIISNPTIQIDDDLFHGQQTWRTSWKYSYSGQGRKCRVKKLKMQIAIRYKRPTLSQPLIDPKHQKAWEEYRSALLVHQQGHKDIALEVTEEVKSAIKSVRGHRSCDDLSEMVNVKANEVLTENRIKHSDYDTKTQFGVNQGANLKHYF